MNFSNLKVGATLKRKKSRELITVVSIDDQCQCFLGSDGQSHAAEVFKRTPASKLGYVVGDKFLTRVVGDTLLTRGLEGPSEYTLITLTQDDGTEAPLFKVEKTGQIRSRFLQYVKPLTA